MRSQLPWLAVAAGAVLITAACGPPSFPTATGVGGTGGATGPGGSGGAGGIELDPNTTQVGQACAFDDDCGGPGSVCITVGDDEPTFTSFWGGDDIGGGVANGYCTRYCEMDNECPDGSRCAGDICLLQCEFGAPELLELDAALSTNKCWGRDDLMCVPTQGIDAVCMPNCGSDAACGTRRCDTRLGVCTDPVRDGLPNGSPCTPDNAATSEDEDPCAGVCLEFFDDTMTQTTAICTGPCSFGGAPGAHDCGGAEAGICAFEPEVESMMPAALGDYGYCAASCGAHDDCDFDGGMFCLDLGNYATLQKGYCVEATPCPIGDECGTDQVCTNSQAGFVCVDDDGGGTPLIPLGNAAYMP